MTGEGIRVVQSCHLLVCLFIYRHFTAKLAISEYDRWHLFVTYYAYLILTYCWFDSNVSLPLSTHQILPAWFNCCIDSTLGADGVCECSPGSDAHLVVPSFTDTSLQHPFHPDLEAVIEDLKVAISKGEYWCHIPTWYHAWHGCIWQCMFQYGDLYICSVCFSPDGKYLATSAEDHQIHISYCNKVPLFSLQLINTVLCFGT